MAANDPGVTAALIAGVTAVATLLLSKRLDNSAIDRRQAANERRQKDRRLRLECERWRELAMQFQTDNAGLRVLLIAHDIPLPPETRLLSAGEPIEPETPGDPE